MVDLTLGDPDLPTPQRIKDEACRALMADKTKYTANAGIYELRKAIAGDVERRTGLTYTTDEISVTAGAMGALYLTAVSLLNPGDEVIILSPHWPNYTNMVKMCGAKPVYVNCLGEQNLKKLSENIARAVTEKTKAVIVNSPSNPTGVVLKREMLWEIAETCKRHNLWVLTDEVYRTIVFGEACPSILEIPDMKKRTILIDSFSKRFCMTGFRVGFVCAPKEIAQSVASLQENVNSCACMFAQYAALEALNNSGPTEREISGIFQSRCDSMAQALQKSKKLGIGKPQATFYLFVNIQKTGLTSEEFAYRLLREEHIAVVPGNAFYEAGEGYIRIACTLDGEKLKNAAKRIVRFADGV